MTRRSALGSCIGLALASGIASCTVRTLDERGDDARSGDRPAPTRPKPAEAGPQPSEPRGERPGADETPPSVTEERADIEVPSTVEPVEAATTLTAPGSEPRAPLRFEPQRGESQLSELTMKMKMGMRIGAQNIPSRSIPTIVTTLATKVNRIRDDGIAYRLSTKNARTEDVADASARVRGAVDKAIEGLRGAKGSVVVSPRGRTQRFEVDVPGQFDVDIRPTLEGFRQSFAQMFPWFPEEAIGVGGKWKAVTHFEQNDVRVQQTTDYELVARDGDVVTLRFSFEQRATDTDRAGAALPGGSFDVEAFAAEGAGEAVVDLGKLVPISGRATSTAKTRAKVTLGGAPQPVAMSVELELELSSPQ